MSKGKMLDVYGNPDPEVDALDYLWQEEWAIEKHADHDQSDHGNWARGIRSSDTIPGTKGTIPPPPGETPIPKDHVRLYHYTQEFGVADKIADEGIRIDVARGEQYGEANLVWASAQVPDPGKEFVEFTVPRSFLDPYRRDAQEGEPTAVVGGMTSSDWAYVERTNPGVDPIQVWQERGNNLAFGSSIPPESIIAVHRPWHHHYRYIANDPESLKETLEGFHDSLLDDKTYPEYGTAIRRIKRDFGGEVGKHADHDQSTHGNWSNGPSASPPASGAYTRVMDDLKENRELVERYDRIRDELLAELEASKDDFTESEYENLKEWVENFNTANENWLYANSWGYGRSGMIEVHEWLVSLDSDAAMEVLEETPNDAFRRMMAGAVMRTDMEFITPEKMASIIDETQKWLDESNSYIRVDFENLDEVLSEGFMNQHGTGDSNGSYNPDLRLMAEDAMFGYSPDDADPYVPIYGLVEHGPWLNYSADQYGDFAIELKDGIPTTVSIDDSLNSGATTMVQWGGFYDNGFMPMDKKKIGLQFFGGNIGQASRWINEDGEGSEGLKRIGRYIEAQFHEPIESSSIKAIHIVEGDLLINIRNGDLMVDDLEGYAQNIPFYVWRGRKDPAPLTFQEWVKSNSRGVVAESRRRMEDRIHSARRGR